MNFKMFLKEKWIILISIIYVAPIIIANVYYIDDMARITGGHGWNPDGRVFTTILMQVLSFGSVITSLYPYSIIIAAIITSLSGYLVAIILFKDKKINLTIASSILLTSPFYLENLSYRYDSMPMSLSLFLSIVPFLFLYKRYFIAISVVCLVLSLGLYQVSSMAYFSLLICILISDINDLTIKKHAQLVVFSLLSFLLAYYLYGLIINHLDISLNRNGFLQINDSTVDVIKYRVHRYYDIYVTLADSGYSFAALPLVVSLLVSYAIILMGGILRVKKIIILSILILSLFILTAMPNLIISEPWYTLRTMICFPFVIYGIASICSQHINSKIINFSVSILIVFSFVLSSVYGSVLKNNDEYDTFLSQSITHDIMSGSNNNKFKVVIYGKADASKKSSLMYDSYPIILKLAPIYSTQDWFWGVKNLSRYLNMDFVTNRDEVYKNMCSYKLISINPIYSIRKGEDVFVVDFTKDKCN